MGQKVVPVHRLQKQLYIFLKIHEYKELHHFAKPPFYTLPNWRHVLVESSLLWSEIGSSKGTQQMFPQGYVGSPCRQNGIIHPGFKSGRRPLSASMPLSSVMSGTSIGSLLTSWQVYLVPSLTETGYALSCGPWNFFFGPPKVDPWMNENFYIYEPVPIGAAEKVDI